MNVCKFLMGCLVLTSANLSALCLPNNIELSGGYRQDDYKTGITYPAANLEGEFVDDDFTIKHINIWQIGIRGRFSFPELNCCNSGCNNLGFLRNFYLKGYGYWGEGDTGTNRFQETFNDTAGNEGIEFGSIKDYEAYDWQIGVGYLFDLGCLFECSNIDLGLGVIGGYSLDHHKFKIKDSAFISRGGDAIFPDLEYNGTKYTSEWKGGWLGAELYYQTCDLLFNLGYEYHWSEWRSTFTPTALGSEVGFTTDKRTSDHAYGNVVYLDTTYFCDCWDVGLGLKYAYYTADKGKVKETPVPEEPTFDGRGTWQTWQITANVGYNF